MFEFMEPVYNLIDFPTDQTKFIISQVFALVFGLGLRRYVKASPENALKRHVLSTLLGLLIGFYCFDTDFYHLLVVALVSYLFLHFLPRAYVHLITFTFVLIYLSSIHLYTQLFHYGLKQFDVTAPMMIFFQKLTYIAFSYNDGMKPVESLSASQKVYVLHKLPSTLEFFGYLFHFQGVAIGPGCTFKDYIEFMDGENFRKFKNDQDIKCTNSEPSVKITLLRKLLYIGIMFVLFFNVSLKYPVELNMSSEILKKPVWYRLLYLHLSGFGQRLYYYVAWTISDFVNNASGFGFNGYDEFGQPKWDLLLNIRILEIERSTSMKMTIDNWHIQSSNWLRRIAFERLPVCKTLGVFFLSAFWHGFYPGYYFTLILSALLVYIGRGIRRNIRPLFIKNKYTSILYSLTGWCCVQFTVNYILISFFYLSIKRSVQFYNSWFWIVHLFVVFGFFVLPRESFKSRSALSASSSSSSSSNNPIAKKID